MVELPHLWSEPLVFPTVCTACGVQFFDAPASTEPCPGNVHHTCVNTGTTLTGAPLPPCRACVAARAREGQPSIRKGSDAEVLALAALVQLDAAAQSFETVAAEQGSSPQVDPRDTEAAVALRKMLKARGVL